MRLEPDILGRQGQHDTSVSDSSGFSYDRCAAYGRAPGGDYIDCMKGTNIAVFINAGDAVPAYGVV